MFFWINVILWAVVIAVWVLMAKPRPLAVAFVVSLYIGLETYIYFKDWLPYLPTGLHFLFYIIPISIYLIVFLIYCKKTKTRWDKAMAQSTCWYVCTIITVWLSLPSVFIFYNWDKAKVAYESEMEELYGEDWEEELKDLEQEKYIR